MSTITFPMKTLELTKLTVPTTADLFLHDDVRIPAGITDLDSFRQWAESDDFPRTGRIVYLAGVIWVDLSLEQAFSHNGVKTEVTTVLHSLTRGASHGRFFSDGMSLVLPAADVSTVPDGMFVTYDSIRTNKLKQIAGRSAGVVEFEGAPDMVLEVVSDSSIEKDFTSFPQHYANAGVGEFWRIDARSEPPRFELLRLEQGQFVPAEQDQDWWRSVIFDRWFRLVQANDPLGNPQFTLEARPVV